MTLWVALPTMTKVLRLHDATVSLVCAGAAAAGNVIPLLFNSPTGKFDYEQSAP